MQPITEETFCKPAGFLFKQIIPSCKPFILLCCFPGSFPVCQDYFSPEVCRVFLCSSRSLQSVAGITNSSLLHRIPRFILARYSRCTFLPEKYFLEKGERFTNAKTVGVPAFTKYLQRLKGVLWLPCSWPSVTQSEWLLPSSIKTDVPKANDKLFCWLAEPFVARATHIWGGMLYKSTLLPTATSN